MKTLVSKALIIASCIITACGNNTSSTAPAITINESSVSTATSKFTVDGKTYVRKVSTQYFGSNKETDNYSIVCQQDEPLAMLQITFANEKNASANNLVPKGGSYKVNEGQYDVTLMLAGSEKQFIVKSNSGGTLTYQNKTATLKNMKLFDADGKGKLVSGELKVVE